MGSDPTAVLHKLPVIEFREDNMKHGTESWSETCEKVISAMEKYGCFVAEYEKLTVEIHDGAFKALEQLFHLPTHTKVCNKSTKPLYGYVGQIPFLPLYESMGIDYATTPQGLHNFAGVMWPDGNDHGFSEKLLVYTKLAAELELMVVKMVFEGYGVEKYYDSHMESANYLCRVMRYEEPKNGESQLGFVSHTDKSFMSTVHQNGVNGLEIRARDGHWFGVDQLSPSSVVVMAGDAIMAWSNNRIASPHHRVSMQGGAKTRFSIAQFSFMESGFVGTPPELVDKDHPAQFNPFEHLKYLEFYSKEENRRLESAIKTYCGV